MSIASLLKSFQPLSRRQDVPVFARGHAMHYRGSKNARLQHFLQVLRRLLDDVCSQRLPRVICY